MFGRISASQLTHYFFFKWVYNSVPLEKKKKKKMKAPAPIRNVLNHLTEGNMSGDMDIAILHSSTSIPFLQTGS